MAYVIKVFTPIKRVPIVIGKAQNGQKLPFGPYTLPQIGGGTLLLIVTAVAAMTLPANPAITFFIGLTLTVVTVLGLGLIRYTGVRLTSRVFWFVRLMLRRKPVAASGIPITTDSARSRVIIEESLVVLFPAAAAPTTRRRQSVPLQQGFGSVTANALGPLTGPTELREHH